DWCFFGPASVRAGMLAGGLRVLRYPYAVVRDLARGEINLRAMSLVYTTLLSLIPLLAFSFAVLKIFGGRRDLEPIVYELFRPVGGAAAQEVVHLPLLQRLRGTGIALAPYLMVTAFFTALYMMIPNTRVQWRAALIGALVGGILWAAVGKMFTAFLMYSTRLTLVYAGFA